MLMFHYQVFLQNDPHAAAVNFFYYHNYRALSGRGQRGLITLRHAGK